MGGDMREVKKVLIEELFRRAGLAWERYQNARRSGKAADMRADMREAYDTMLQLLAFPYRRGFQKEVEDFLKKNGMPVRDIVKRLKE